MKRFLRRYGRRLLILPPLLAGLVVLVLAVQSRPPPERLPETETARPARVVPAPRLDVIPRAIGHGNVQPGRVWDAVAEVGGRVIHVHPDLKNGVILPAGTELIRIDPSAYELALAQVEAQIKELEIKERNTRKSLDIERRTLDSLRRDLARKRTLLERGAAAQSSVDAAERALLQGEQQVQTLENTLALIPSERAVLEAKRKDAQRDLARTRITAPFDIRIRSSSVEVDQYASRGQVLAQADGIDTAEVPAQVPLDRMWTLLRTSPAEAGDATAVAARLPEMLGLDPVVRLEAGDLTVTWPARLARVAETIDPKTRTVGVIVAVDEPYDQAQPGVRPPLARNMFVEVELRGRPYRDRVVIPRAAIRDGAVWVLDADNRLRRRPVETLFRQGNLAVVEKGLEEGARVVVTDLVPAVEGMLVEPVTDEAVLARLTAQARGEEPLR